MTEQNLDRPYIAGLAVDQGNLGPAERVRSVGGCLDPDLPKPAFQQARIVPRRDAIPVVPPGREQAVAASGPAHAYPGEHAAARALRHLEPDRGSCLLLDDQRQAPHYAASHHIADPQLDEVAAAQLTVDRQVEQGEVACSALPLQMKSD